MRTIWSAAGVNAVVPPVALSRMAAQMLKRGLKLLQGPGVIIRLLVHRHRSVIVTSSAVSHNSFGEF